MYFRAIRQLAQALRNIDLWLDRAEEHAARKKLEIDILLGARLAPDMADFVYQIQSACDYVKGAAGWLSGEQPPRHEDNEETISDLRIRIEKTLTFVDSLPEAAYQNAAQQIIRVSWAPAGSVIHGQDYLLQVAIPNIYFHLTTAYAILRHNGVDVGKMDFLGPIDWISAR
jgi:hypothetical protein